MWGGAGQKLFLAAIVGRIHRSEYPLEGIRISKSRLRAESFMDHFLVSILIGEHSDYSVICL